MCTPLCVRSGRRPRTTDTNPHRQLEQIAPPAFQEALWARMRALPDVDEGPSLISVPGARALFLRPTAAGGPDEAFMTGREFVHLHPASDGSLHMALPPARVTEAVAAGWGELHPLAASGRVPPTVLLVYGPRNAAELETVWELVQASHRFACGTAPAGGEMATPSDGA